MGITDNLINNIWGGTDRQWVAMDARNTAGGIILQMEEHWIRFLMNAVYGPVRAQGRKALWPELKRVSQRFSGLWIVGGDFNTIRFPEEKNPVGRITTSMRKLSDFILEHELVELPLEGARYTWTNNQDRLVLRRLDRVLISMEWEEHFQLISQRALPRPIYDHNPILIEMSEFSGGPQPF
ncbi:uncharacterized protein LOC143855396 [Tasmannia lanceolata]|uniref:uncharacterized protein LOC143855396 n=1 Tax=Tasmannia lanceolata TaxID=3420 RepID=UPI00406340EB